MTYEHLSTQFLIERIGTSFPLTAMDVRFGCAERLGQLSAENAILRQAAHNGGMTMATNRKVVIGAIGRVRATGSLLVAAVKAMMSEVPDATEEEMLAAEKEALANTPLAPPIESGGKVTGKTDLVTMVDDARKLGSTPYIEPIVPAGTAGTVTLPVTKHVLSVPRPDIGEMFVGYVQRVGDQATGGKNEEYKATIPMLFQGTGYLFDGGVFNPDPSSWPLAADKFYNGRAYMTTEQQAKDAANKAAQAAWLEKLRQQYAPK